MPGKVIKNIKKTKQSRQSRLDAIMGGIKSRRTPAKKKKAVKK